MESLICISDMYCNYGVNGSSDPNVLIYNGVRAEGKRLVHSAGQNTIFTWTYLDNENSSEQNRAQQTLMHSDYLEKTANSTSYGSHMG